MYKTESVTIHGFHYKVGCTVVLQYEQDVPIFGLIKDIIVYDKDKYFIIQNTLGPAFFDQHILHYVLEEINQLLIKSYHSLKFKWSLRVYSYENKFVTHVKFFEFMFPIQKRNTIEHLIADLGYKLETQVNLKMPVFKIWNALVVNYSTTYDFFLLI